MMPHVGTLRASAVWGLPDVLATLGVETSIVLNDARLPRDVFSSRDNVFTYRQMERLLLACEQRSDCDYIGLLIGRRTHLADTGLAGRAALCEPTAGKGLRSFIDHLNLRNTTATMTLIESGSFATFAYALSEQGTNDTRHFQLGSIAGSFNVLQELFGPEWLPVEVRFASRSPSSLRPFRTLFRAPVQFDCEESAIVFSSKWLNRPLPPVSERLRREVLARVAAERAKMLADFPATLRSILRKRLVAGDFKMDDVAALLSMHRRTLNRRLTAHGIAYGELVESVKEDVARQLLRETNIPIQRIAEAVRYSSAANFATAFKRRAGLTPREYRRSQRFVRG